MLPKISLFKEFSTEELEALEIIAERYEVRRGEVLFKAGDMNADLFIVESGEIEICVNDITGITKVISNVKDGEFLGEMSILDPNSPRSSTARVVRSSMLFRIPSTELWQLLNDNSPLGRNIHNKLMQALSRRLRDVTQRAASVLKCPENKKGKIVSVVSSGNGVGKTTLATNLAHILSRELNQRVLFLDLDLHYADGTFLLGVYNQKSIASMARAMRQADVNQEQLSSYFAPIHENLWLLAAPNNILEAEHINAEDFSKILSCCQHSFDYVIVDAHEGINPIILSAIETSDQCLYLLNSQDILSVKNAVRYFQVLNTFKVAEDRISVFANRAKDDFRVDLLPKTRLRVMGALPEIADVARKEGKTIYQVDPNNRFCVAVRGLIRNLIHNVGRPTPSFAQQKTVVASQPEAARLSNSNGNGNGANGAAPRVAPDTLTILINEMKLMLDEGMLAEAEAEARELLTFCHDSSELYQVFGEILICQKLPEEAIIVFRKAMELDPENIMAMGMLAHLLGDREQLLKAIQKMVQKIKASAGFADCWNSLGRLHGLAGQFEDAQKAFRKALDLNPKFSDARINLAVILNDAGNSSLALKELERLGKHGLRGHYLAGCIYQDQGQFALAYKEFKQAAKLRTDYHDLSQRLESLHSYFAKMENLVKMHRRHIERHPEFPDLHYKLAELYIEMANDAEAVAELKEALRLKPDYKEAK